MFKWFYKRVADEILSSLSPELAKDLIFKVMNDSEVQEGIVGLTDMLYERYKSKLFGTIGGLQKGLNYAQRDAFPQIFDKKGQLSFKGIFPMLIQAFLGKEGEKTEQKSDIPRALQL